MTHEPWDSEKGERYTLERLQLLGRLDAEALRYQTVAAMVKEEGAQRLWMVIGWGLISSPAELSGRWLQTGVWNLEEKTGLEENKDP